MTIRPFLGTRRHEHGVTAEGGAEGGAGRGKGCPARAPAERGPAGGRGETPGMEGTEGGLGQRRAAVWMAARAW